MLMPSRLALNGLHRSGDNDSSASKPFRVSRHRLSEPPTIAASHRPAVIRRLAEANALADEEHAVEIVYLGPDKPR